MKISRLYLPKPVYEIFPFLYVGLGAACIATSHSSGLNILGAYFIFQGVFKSILRLNYRSPHQALTKSPSRQRES